VFYNLKISIGGVSVSVAMIVSVIVVVIVIVAMIGIVSFFWLFEVDSFINKFFQFGVDVFWHTLHLVNQSTVLNEVDLRHT